eukprot:7512225-Pyramimonas_sp.AAC.1
MVCCTCARLRASASSCSSAPAPNAPPRSLYGAVRNSCDSPRESQRRARGHRRGAQARPRRR